MMLKRLGFGGGLDRRGVLVGLAAFGLAAPAIARRSDETRVSIVSFDLLRPSQGAVGMREVATKTAEIIERARKPDKLEKFLTKEALPVVKGPGGGLHIIDHHHLGRSLWDSKRPNVHVELMADLSTLAVPAFWTEMDKRGWLHAYDAKGVFLGPDKLPRHLKDMGDDVYRSLAGAVRRSGGYDKSDVPFAEFKWADFFRTQLPLSTVERDFDGAVKAALNLAQTAKAVALPGFNGLKRKAG